MFTSAGRRYLAAPGSAPAQVALASGSVVARSGNWYVIAEGAVVRLGRVETDSGTGCLTPSGDGGETDDASDGPKGGSTVEDAGDARDVHGIDSDVDDSRGSSDPSGVDSDVDGAGNSSDATRIEDGGGSSDTHGEPDFGTDANAASSSCGCRTVGQPAARVSSWAWLWAGMAAFMLRRPSRTRKEDCAKKRAEHPPKGITGPAGR
jgi:MYXO-CTERM domain-containing protein